LRHGRRVRAALVPGTGARARGVRAPAVGSATARARGGRRDAGRDLAVPDRGPRGPARARARDVPIGARSLRIALSAGATRRRRAATPWTATRTLATARR